MIIERIWNAVNEQQNAINAAADKQVTQLVMAQFYADCIVADDLAFSRKLKRVDFLAVNRAIRDRWPKGLERVKNMAWKILKKR